MTRSEPMTTQRLFLTLAMIVAWFAAILVIGVVLLNAFTVSEAGFILFAVVFGAGVTLLTIKAVHSIYSKR